MDNGQATIKKTLISVCFLLGGCSVIFSYQLAMIAAEDILSGLAIPTSVVFISLSAPGLLASLTSPLYFDRIGNLLKIGTATFVLIMGLVIVALAQIEWKLAGVACLSLSITIEDMTFLSLTSFYGDFTVGAYSFGTGFSMILTSLYYLASTVVLHVSPRAAVLGVSWVPLLAIVSYLTLRKLEPSRLGDPKTNHKDYKPVPLMEEDDKPLNTRLSNKEKVLAIWKIFHHIIAFVIGLFAAYLSVQGITSTLVYKQTGLAPREVFVVYNNVFTAACFIGRSYSFVIFLVNPSLKTYTKYTWALATAAVALMLFLLIESWYRSFNKLVLVCVSLAFMGLILGVLYVNAYAMVGVSNDARINSVTRAFTVTAFKGGILMAGLMALYVEPIIQKHCLFLTDGKAELCLTRSSSSVL